MRVALVTNALDQPTRGNHTTVQRWIAHARDAEVVAVPADPEQRLDPAPDIVHGYHALHGGVAALALARRYGLPLVVSVGGTDLRAFLDGDATAAEVFSSAACVTGSVERFGTLLGDDVPYVTVPRGVPIPDTEPRRPDGTLRVLLPAGLRPVKDPLFAISLARRLAERGLPLRLDIIGPVLDAAYAERVRAEAAGFAHLGEVAPEEMPAAYVAADVVWNTSLFEGGANALLEALAHGCAVFARDVTGNRDLLEAHHLFDPDDVEAALSFHSRLLDESFDDRRSRVAANRRWLQEHHDAGVEAAALGRVWRSASRVT